MQHLSPTLPSKQPTPAATTIMTRKETAKLVFAEAVGSCLGSNKLLKIKQTKKFTNVSPAIVREVVSQIKVTL